jgi:hypothetical protein
MAIFRIIFLIILSPIRLFVNLFRHKDNLLEWHFNYSYFVQIKTVHKGQTLSDDLLITSYILFLARYFYICDKRQINIVRDLLIQEIGNIKSNPKELPAKVINIVRQTLNSWEQNAATKIFGLWGVPLVYSEDEEPNPSRAKYSFLVYQQNGKLTSTFYMSAGPDIILLPQTIAILYGFVVDKLKNEDKKEKLNNSIIDLLKAYSQINCRLSSTMKNLPLEILAKNNIQNI